MNVSFVDMNLCILPQATANVWLNKHFTRKYSCYSSITVDKLFINSWYFIILFNEFVSSHIDMHVNALFRLWKKEIYR